MTRQYSFCRAFVKRFLILPIAGGLEERARAVEITGDTDPILPTPFRIGETSAAALAAIGLAVSDLWALRTGRRQEAARGRSDRAARRPRHPVGLAGRCGDRRWNQGVPEPPSSSTVSSART